MTISKELPVPPAYNDTMRDIEEHVTEWMVTGVLETRSSHRNVLVTDNSMRSFCKKLAKDLKRPFIHAHVNDKGNGWYAEVSVKRRVALQFLVAQLLTLGTETKMWHARFNSMEPLLFRVSGDTWDFLIKDESVFRAWRDSIQSRPECRRALKLDYGLPESYQGG